MYTIENMDFHKKYYANKFEPSTGSVRLPPHSHPQFVSFFDDFVE